jgi:hypothetical protein
MVELLEEKGVVAVNERERTPRRLRKNLVTENDLHVDFYLITMNNPGGTLLDDIAIEGAKAGAKVVIPKIIENRQAIGQKIKHTFKKFK